MAEVSHERIRVLTVKARQEVGKVALPYRPLPFHEKYQMPYRLGEKVKDKVTGEEAEVVGGKRYRFLVRRR